MVCRGCLLACAATLFSRHFVPCWSRAPRDVALRLPGRLLLGHGCPCLCVPHGCFALLHVWLAPSAEWARSESKTGSERPREHGDALGGVFTRSPRLMTADYAPRMSKPASKEHLRRQQVRARFTMEQCLCHFPPAEESARPRIGYPRVWSARMDPLL